ncbi:hypothetical protein DNU06_12610 [Putridiphycobacter roseus]|uniref:Signal transduction histidine kinase internal region domain-containing protein n=1 Tax=Putridiphycobacter roseus TaxID=2219161 RepID=A0A2W1NE97_9FLAO|nr:histidine kinase [Putridiphycobacter roseus]PZE16386.1 hypothetical protein DNU06_12610 [Putridiphycobacter roseus]
MPAFFCYGQSAIYKKFGINEGLPSSETYDLYQDSLGYIWITTDRGLSRFDGETFTNYNVSEGLPNEVVFHFFEESNHKLWFSAKNKKLYYFDPLKYPIKFKAFEFNHLLDSFYIQSPLAGHIKRFKQVGDTFYISYPNIPGYLALKTNNSFHFYHDKFKNKETNNLPNTEIHIDPNFSFTKLNLSTIKNDSILVYNHSDHKTYRTIHQIKTPLDIEKIELIKCNYSPNETVLILHKELIILKAGKLIVKKLNGSGNDIKRLSNHHLLVATDLGLLEYDADYNLIHHFFPQQFITSVLIDQNQGIWATSIQNGIYHIQNTNILELTVDGRKFPGRKLTFNGDYLFIINGKFNTSIFKNNQLLHQTNKTYFTKRNDFIAGNDKKLNAILGPNFPFYINTNNESLNSYYVGTSKDKYFVSASGKYLGVKTNTQKVHFEFISALEIYEIVALNDSIIYLATDNGFYTYNYNRKTILEKSANADSFFHKPQRIIRTFNDYYIAGSESNGLAIFNDSVFFKINMQDGLLDNHPTGIALINDSVFWMSSYSGLNKVTCRFKTNTFNIQSFTQSNTGFLSNEITDIKLNKDTLWATTKTGTFCFQKDIKVKQNKTYFNIDSISIENTKILPQEAIYAEVNEVISIYYQFIDYRIGKKQDIEYRLSNKEKTPWKKVNANQLFLQSNKYGKYHLQIRTKNDQRIIYEHVVFIMKPFWVKWDFILLAIILLCLVLYMIIQVFVFINDKKRQREIDKIKLEIKAINAQMNPHFTFNTINSIQHYLIQNDIVGGINYLNDYAKIVRKSLEFSRREIISLQEEIDFLFLYANLEKKRFEKNFNFKFVSKINLEPSAIFIPSLLLQPIIENAIIHGINAIEYKGELVIGIHEEKKCYLIEIIDNGLGFDHTNVMHSTNSYGLKIVNERLNIYNEGLKIKQPITFEFKDPINQTGTKVSIRINKHIKK